jgi:hypothetical protein
MTHLGMSAGRVGGCSNQGKTGSYEAAAYP